jgi:hypothetical protein
MTLGRAPFVLPSASPVTDIGPPSHCPKDFRHSQAPRSVPMLRRVIVGSVPDSDGNRSALPTEASGIVSNTVEGVCAIGDSLGVPVE